MNCDALNPLPVCEVVREDPARPPLRRCLKFSAMKAAGRLATWMMRLPRQQRREEFGILIYHRVAPLVQGFAPPTYNVPPSVFREQIIGLRKRGFKFVSLREVLKQRSRHESLSPRSVVLTFDDGFESVYEFAWPTLREFNVPATVFVNTGYLDQETPFPFDAWGQAYAGQAPPVSYRPLTTAQCRTMADSGLIEIGAHTHTHADFRGREDLFRNDMRVCVKHLQDHFGIKKPTFAFPFGKPSMGFTQEALLSVVREMKLPCALTTEAVRANISDSPHLWGRFNVYSWDDPQTLTAKLLGYYSWAPRLADGLVQILSGRFRGASQVRSAADWKMPEAVMISSMLESFM